MKEFKGTQGELEASGLFVKPIGKHPIGQAFVIDFKHDVGGRSIPDVQGAQYAKLWAAAPELLEACIRMVNDVPIESGNYEAYQLAKAAINKALEV